MKSFLYGPENQPVITAKEEFYQRMDAIIDAACRTVHSCCIRLHEETLKFQTLFYANR